MKRFHYRPGSGWVEQVLYLVLRYECSYRAYGRSPQGIVLSTMISVSLLCCTTMLQSTPYPLSAWSLCLLPADYVWLCSPSANFGKRVTALSGNIVCHCCDIIYSGSALSDLLTRSSTALIWARAQSTVLSTTCQHNFPHDNYNRVYTWTRSVATSMIGARSEHSLQPY